MRKIVMTLLAGGSLLLTTMVAEAGVLTGIRTVGSGLNAKIEVAADASLTFVFFRKDATHWVIDLAKTEMGSVEPVIDPGIPATTGITAEKRQAGSIPITRLTVAVRPGVSMNVKPSADRKQLTISFQSGMAPPAAAKDDDLLGDLDAPAKPAGTAPAAKDDLDALLDAPAAPAKSADAALAAELDLEPAAKTPAVPAQPKAASPDAELDDLKDAPPVAVKPAPAKSAALDQELDALTEPAAAVAPVTAEPAKVPLPSPAAAKAATPPLPGGVELGALTPDELGIASPEVELSTPAAKPAAVVEPSLDEEPVAGKPAAAKAAEGGKTGSLTVTDSTVEILVDNFSSYKAFSLTDPTRLVVDLIGAKASLKEAAAKARVPGIKTVRFSQYPDKVRIVFDLPKGGLPVYKIEKLENGIKVKFN